ncbi:MAG TPA: heavy metal translocating P-type ATPase [Actinomycetota bacterium]
MDTRPATETPVVELDLEGMTCASCATRIEKVLRRQEGVTDANVNFAAERARVAGDVDVDRLIEAVAKAGYRARPGKPARGDAASAAARAVFRRFLVAAALTVPAMAIAMIVAESRWAMALTWILVTPVQFWSGWPFLRSASLNARHGVATMDTLVAVGTLAAYLYSAWVTVTGHGHAYFETAGTIITLILLGKYFELTSRGRASAAIRMLLERGAKQARVLRDGQEVMVDVALLQPGEVFLVKPGEKIATDGIVRAGSSAIDESLVTGESLPREKSVGDEVIGGTMNAHGALTVEATKVGADTALAQIARLVEEAQGSKAPIQRLADRVAGVFVPVVLLIAAGTFAAGLLQGDPVGDALVPSVAVLIIACPCAMGLATPVAIMVGTGRGAQMGVLIRGGDVLERSRSIDAVVLDKTGTITEGRMRVTDVEVDPWNGGSSDAGDVLIAAAAVEQSSEHPIAAAVVRAARDRGATIPAATGFEAIGGSGARATVGPRDVFVGRASYLGDHALMSCSELDERKAALEGQGKTVFGVGWDRRVRGLIAVADTMKASSPAAVAALRTLGADVVMLTGDNEATAKAIAAQAGIARVVAEVLPQHKVDAVRALQAEGKRVAMAGDGVNDAPALAQADLGIAIGSGTDVAIEASDITLVGDDLLGVPTAIRLARRTYRNIVQNLFWAFAYNVALIPLAAVGKVDPMLAALAMGLSSVSVVTNALRLKRVRPMTGGKR